MTTSPVLIVACDLLEVNRNLDCELCSAVTRVARLLYDVKAIDIAAFDLGNIGIFPIRIRHSFPT